MQIDGVLVILKVFGGLGLFLLGMKHLSEGLQAIAEKKLRNLIASATKNRLTGVGMGSFVTAIIQSSSIVTAMVVGFVSTSLMTLPQAISVIIGANIGTTATAWIIAILPSVERLGLGLIAVSSLVYLFSKRERMKNTGLVFLALGLIFFGLYTMKTGMKPIALDETIKAYFVALDPHNFIGVLKCIAISAVFTALIQSSSATTALTMGLASTGVINFETAAAAVLGMNIGTTLTSWFASLSGTTEARRAAMAHIMFNVIGVLLILPFFLGWIIPGMRKLVVTSISADGAIEFTNIKTVIAYLHTGFNVVNMLVFMPFIYQFARLIRRMVPAAPVKEIPRLTVLDNRIIATPILAIEQATKEVMFMGKSNIDLLDTFRKLLKGEIDEELEHHIFHREEILDNIQREITTFLGQIMTGRLPREAASRARVLLRVTDEFESISDEVASLLNMLKRIRKHKLVISEDGLEELLQVHDQITAFCKYIDEATNCDLSESPNRLIHIGSESANIHDLIKKIRKLQMKRLEDKSANAMKIVVCMDMLSAYSRIKENLLNVGETINGEKTA